MSASKAHKPTPHMNSLGWLGGSGGVPGVPIKPLLSRSADHRDPGSHSSCDRSISRVLASSASQSGQCSPRCFPIPQREIGRHHGMPQQGPSALPGVLFWAFTCPVLGVRVWCTNLPAFLLAPGGSHIPG